MIRFRLTPDAEPKFYQYFFNSRMGRGHLLSMATGAVQQNLNITNVSKLVVPLPPAAEQQAIAAILSAYDDLIKNNTRRIKILEEMAQMIYREWFVNFRFPGHERVKMVESELGSIPEGWRQSTIGEAVLVLGGGTPSTSVQEYWDDGDIVWYSPSDLTAAGTMFMSDSSKHITRLGLDRSSARLFPPRSVMMTSRATIGVVAINTVEACTNQGFITCIPSKAVGMLQLYFWLLENKSKIVSLATGATFKEINKATFRQLPIEVAPGTISAAFEATAAPITKLVANLVQKNANLRTTRDLLLPKLISGEIPVEVAEELAAELVVQAT